MQPVRGDSAPGYNSSAGDSVRECDAFPRDGAPDNCERPASAYTIPL
jgi:hypothetical protein